MSRTLSATLLSVALLVACGTNPSAQMPTLNSGDLSIQVSQLSGCDSTLSTLGVDGGGANGKFKASSTSCSSYSLSISGTTENAESVLIEGNGIAASVTVEEGGTFSVILNVASIENLNLRLTPMAAELGTTLAIDPSLVALP